MSQCILYTPLILSLTSSTLYILYLVVLLVISTVNADVTATLNSRLLV
jgi:hypothetical protein